MTPSLLFRAAVFAAVCYSGAQAIGMHYTVAPEDIYADDGNGSGFFNKFDFFTSHDPTNGFVDYKGRASASSLGLIKTVGGRPQISVDSDTNLAKSAVRGRASVRIYSKKIYNGGLFIADIEHMPGGQCGIWPAWWTVGVANNYPDDGEIDIIENISLETSNYQTLHTNNGCKITPSAQGGTLANEGFCSNTYKNPPLQYANQGCSVKGAEGTFGAPFNGNKGGVYAMEWTSTSIKIWNWARSVIPSDIKSGNPDPSTWGTPTLMAGDQCTISKHFKDHTMIFNTDFCGDLVNARWRSSGCYNPTLYPDCETYVRKNPQAFADSFWSINSVKVYQLTPVVSSSSSSAMPSTTSTSSRMSSTTSSSLSSSSTTSSSSSSSSTATISSPTLAGSSSTSPSLSSSSSLKSYNTTTPPSSSSVAPSTSTSASPSNSTSTSATTATSSSPTSPYTASSTVASSSLASSNATSSSSSLTASASSWTASSSTAGSISSSSATTSSTPGGVFQTSPTTSVGPYTNSSAPVTTTSAPATSGLQMTTSIIYTTLTSTITACPSTVVNCPAESTITVISTIPLYTTVCPASAQTTQSTSTTGPAPMTTSTVYTTRIITVTACPSSVPNCPATAKTKSVITSTYALYTTVCPITAASMFTSKALTPVPAVTASTSPTTTVVITQTIPVVPMPVAPNASASKAANNMLPSIAATTSGLPKYVPGSGAARGSVEGAALLLALAVVGALVLQIWT